MRNRTSSPPDRDSSTGRLRAASYAVSAAVVAVCAGLAAAAWARVEGDIVPVHWNAQLRPDRFGSKPEGLLLPTAALVLVVACFHFTTTRGRATGAGARAAYVTWIWSVAFVGTLVATTTYNVAFDGDVGRGPAFLPALAVVAGAGALLGIRTAVRGRPTSDDAPVEPGGRYWFKAKRYGYGWSRPSSWEGWAISTAYVGAQVAAAALGQAWLWLGLVGLVAGTPLLLWACVRKGEPARWRWGGRA